MVLTHAILLCAAVYVGAFVALSNWAYEFYRYEKARLRGRRPERIGSIRRSSEVSAFVLGMDGREYAGLSKSVRSRLVLLRLMLILFPLYLFAVQRFLA